MSMVIALTFHRIQIGHIDGLAIAEQHHQDRQADGRLGGCHRENEEHEYLARVVTEIMGKGDEVHVHRQQHELDGHEQDDHILAVEEDAGHGQTEHDGRQDEDVRQGDHEPSSRPSRGSEGMETMRMRSSRRTATCTSGFWVFTVLRRRMVREMAATMATSRITAATSKAYRYSV